MRLDRPARWLSTAFTYTLIALGFLGDCLVFMVLAPFFAVAWCLDAWDRNFGPQRGEWQRWFAWRPVYLGRGLDAVVWLENLERTDEGWFTLHRYPGDTSIQASWEYVDPEEG